MKRTVLWVLIAVTVAWIVAELLELSSPALRNGVALAALTVGGTVTALATRE